MPALAEVLAAPLQQNDLHREPLQTILRHVQGNILHAHGRDFATHVLLEFQDGKQARVRQWLREQLVGKLMSAQEQLAERQLYQEAKARFEKGESTQKPQKAQTLFVSCTLSASGYRFLGWPTTQMSREFLAGMKQARERLHDPDAAHWERPYRTNWHALILLAHQDKEALDAARQSLIDAPVRPFVAHAWVENGAMLGASQDEARPRVEHFGFADGLSQPVFFQSDSERKRPKTSWHTGVGPHLVLTRDPLGGDTDYGSYLVFRKLEQDVAGFEKQLHALAAALSISPDEAAARVIGRFKDGRPLALAATASSLAAIPNTDNFRYDIDWAGKHCPFNAHIRRMNPRWVPGELRYDRRIARRGIPYGTPGSGQPVGLLFMCYQQNLASQFEALQGEWAHTAQAFPPSGEDALLGHNAASPGTGGQQALPAMGGCVTLKGGEYFFAPSLHVLRTRL